MGTFHRMRRKPVGLVDARVMDIHCGADCNNVWNTDRAGVKGY